MKGMKGMGNMMKQAQKLQSKMMKMREVTFKLFCGNGTVFYNRMYRMPVISHTMIAKKTNAPPITG